MVIYALTCTDTYVPAELADAVADQRRCVAEAAAHVIIDLSASFASGVRDGLPDATLVADRFHVIALANQAVSAVRQRVVREQEGRRGRKVDPAWRVRRRLLAGHEHLRPETFEKMWNALIDTGDPGLEILGADRAARHRATAPGRRDHLHGAQGTQPVSDSLMLPTLLSLASYERVIASCRG